MIDYIKDEMDETKETLNKVKQIRVLMKELGLDWEGDFVEGSQGYCFFIHF